MQRMLEKGEVRGRAMHRITVELMTNCTLNPELADEVVYRLDGESYLEWLRGCQSRRLANRTRNKK